ncbi:MAG: nucleoid occlusion protein [Culicoidibacterales bacterium]
MGLFDFLGTKNEVNIAEERQKIVELKIEEVIPNQYQPRQIFDEQALEELAASIEEHGILQPIVVRENSKGKYEIIAGERRFRASQKIGATTVPVIIKEMTDEQSAALAIIENIQRENLSVVEEAQAYQQLMILHGLKQEELAKRIGKSQSTIANKLRLLKLSPTIKEALNKKLITERHGRALLQIKEPLKREKTLAFIIENQLNVSQTELLIKQQEEQENDHELTETQEDQGKKPRIKKRAAKDIRLAMNTIKQTINQIQTFGHEVEVSEADHDAYYEVVIRLPKE